MASNKPTTNAPTGKAPIIKKMFLHNRKTNHRYRINGAKETDRKPKKACLNRDFSQYVAYATPQLPQKVDLRPWMTQIEDQSGANSCTANAMAGLYEYLNYRTTGRLEDVSRLFIYYNARVRDNDDNPHVIDDGSIIPSTIETIEEFGVCPEYIWPYNMKKVNTKPTKQAYSVAPQYSISEALKLDINVNEMKSCLAQGFPILTIIELYKSFDKAEAHGVVPMPKSNETSRSSHGSHALLLSGYSDHSRAFIVRNSWGASWGDRGYCYIPYDYICNDKLCDSAWTVKKLGVATMGNEGWEDEDEVDYLDDDDEEDDDEDDDDADIEEVDEEDEPEDDDYEDDDDDDDEEEE